MTELLTSPEFIWSWMGLAGAVLVVLLFISAPYGRHLRTGWGPMIPARLGWVLMELPALVIPPICFIIGDRWTDPVAQIFLFLWLFHYIYRTLVYPFLIRARGKPVPVFVVGLGAVFNTVNGAVQGAFLFLGTPPHTTGWFTDGRFGLGLCLFLVGFFIHFRSDAILRRLRWTENAAYRIPHGLLYRWVSQPNYLGEMLQWVGWAALTWSLAGASFAVWTIANLLPRALSNHRWYQEQFEDYPEKRRAVLPYLL